MRNSECFRALILNKGNHHCATRFTCCAHTPLAGRLLPLGLLLVLLGVIGGVVWGAEHVGRVEALVDQLSDTSAQIRIRLTVLLVAGVALAAFGLGFEAVLGAFLAGVLVRTLDPEPEVSHPHYPIKLEAVGFGLLIPVFFINSGVTVDVKGLLEDPRALVGVPLLIIALLVALAILFDVWFGFVFRR